VAELVENRNTVKSIQLLRAVAALSVVYVHCTTAGDYQFPSTGAFGVDIFFVISGFIIAYMGSRNTDRFLIKRIIRIWPLYILGTVAMTLTVLLFPHLVHSTTVSVTGFITSVLFIPYQGNRGFPILGQGWTLNFEMFFYLLMALCVMLIKNKKYNAIVCAGALVVFLIVINLINHDIYILSRYQNGLFPEFIYGIILYYVYERYGKQPLKTNNFVRIAALLLLAILSYAYMVFGDIYQFNISGNRNINWGIPSLLLVASLLFLEQHIRDSKLVKWGMELGEASYAMYLFHYHIVTLFSRLVFPRIFGNSKGFAMELLKLIIAICATVFFSVLIYEFIDKPIQKFLRGILRKSKN
jgi:peptidoglycan/LPS O-acetylase OafA/YrhL